MVLACTEEVKFCIQESGYSNGRRAACRPVQIKSLGYVEAGTAQVIMFSGKPED